jgi:hypothetical protein
MVPKARKGKKIVERGRIGNKMEKREGIGRE